MCEAKSSQPHRLWAEVSSSAAHLHKRLLVSPIQWRCLRVLCSERRPLTILDCVLLQDKSWSL